MAAHQAAVNAVESWSLIIYLAMEEAHQVPSGPKTTRTSAFVRGGPCYKAALHNFCSGRAKQLNHVGGSNNSRAMKGLEGLDMADVYEFLRVKELGPHFAVHAYDALPSARLYIVLTSKND